MLGRQGKKLGQTPLLQKNPLLEEGSESAPAPAPLPLKLDWDGALTRWRLSGICALKERLSEAWLPGGLR